MRIAFLVWYFPTLSETFIINQVVGLLERGHDVHIYPAFRKFDNLVGRVHPLVKEYNLLKHTFYPPSPQNYVLRVLKGLRLAITKSYQEPHLFELLNFFRHGKPAYTFRWLYTAVAMLEQEPYDIIHAQFGTLGSAALSLRCLRVCSTAKVITHFRGIDITRFVQEKGKNVYKELFKEGDLFLANCDFFRQKAIQLGCDENKIIVHGSGIDYNKFPFKPRQLPDSSPIRIATTGRLVEKKGLEYAIRAVASVLKAYPYTKYFIVGDGPLKESLLDLTKKLGIVHAVQFLGERTQEELIHLLDSCHIFVAPSVTASSGDQDAPVNTLKEAMAMGLPVISTLHGGIPELVEDGVSGFLVPECDSEAISSRLDYLIKHPETWIQMGKAGREIVERNYDLNKLNEKLVDIYKNLAKT
jgi:colanic acid/amylovoran biosynthesis glycosyltransferase